MTSSDKLIHFEHRPWPDGSCSVFFLPSLHFAIFLRHIFKSLDLLTVYALLLYTSLKYSL